MKAKDLGEQLITDRARYESHPDCKTLVCFGYDPERGIGNPVEIERELEMHGAAPPGALEYRSEKASQWHK